MLTGVTAACIWLVRLTKENISPNIWHWVHAKYLLNIVSSDFQLWGVWTSISPIFRWRNWGLGYITPKKVRDLGSNLRYNDFKAWDVAFFIRQSGSSQGNSECRRPCSRKTEKGAGGKRESWMESNLAPSISWSFPFPSSPFPLPLSFCAIRSAIISRTWSVS